ncbi:hypothetical protein V2A60_007978 [Cordyceps javanica]|uniref:Nuclear envelope pore membrane protein n=1 Tax=Cordyceps javanica TaxID=43265 RepID=A0A545V965_9HYPO|nr:nuclear envelope pore membrane protein [Cordyceps javanica]TQW09487.1 nuclear envelope pore membrane protein [Cordyceps javanica]
MSATPRLRSGYPSTPGTAAPRRNVQQTPSTVGSVSSTASFNKSATLPLAPEKAVRQNQASQPLIPLTLLDAPQQRFYAFAVYVLLWAWKLYDWLQVVEEGDSSWWLFFKWIFIDFAFLFGLPELRIPWLELSQFLVTSVFMSHLVINYMLMFNIPLPWQSFFLGIAKVLYDRELSISEQNVKVSSILNNHSLIMGKQIINILPEGSAMLNPEHKPYCIASKSKTGVVLPIYFNSTVPAEIELIRIDLDTNKEEKIKIANRDVSKIAKQIREQSADPNMAGFQWDYNVRRPGVYRLGRVLDEYKLEIQRGVKDTYVVPCPQAKILTADSSQRCIRDLSDLSLEVVGTPPLKIVYSRTINGKNHGFHFQSLQPDGFSSPLLGSTTDVLPDGEEDISWVRPARVTVGLNESMTASGEWEYSVDEVHDAFGNSVKYAESADDLDHSGARGLVQKFAVKERPKVKMQGCDLRNALKVGKGTSSKLPISFQVKGGVPDTAYKVQWKFSPIDTLTNNGDHGDKSTLHSYSAKKSDDKPSVSAPGLYTLTSVSSGSCEGEVDEPSSCLLLNPLEPQLSVRAEEIPDKCAGNSIGLRVNLDLVGTPPFVVRYDIIGSDQHVESRTHRVDGLRSQLELIPQEASRQKYVFKSISDDVYRNIPLTGQDKILEQEVKPAANAVIAHGSRNINTCLDSNVELDVVLTGEPPFNLEWEVIHDGKRKTERANDLNSKTYTIQTPTFTKGGEYILALSSVKDQRGCKSFLQDQIKIIVRRQRPRGAFGLIEQKQTIMAVEDTALRLPLRLQGDGPWTVSYRNLNDSVGTITKKIDSPNGFLVVKSRGVYELLDIRDHTCPGTVEPAGSTFGVDWFPRPEISIIETDSVSTTDGGFMKQEVCEGDIDGFEVKLQGSPPYHVEYEVQQRSPQGSKAISRREFDAALSKAAISMDTGKAGEYTYKFHGLADNLYNADQKSKVLTVQQRVNAKPAAIFTKPGQSFKFCMEEQEHEDKIPITLTGVAPFFVELEIKHQAGSPAETYHVPSINSNSYAMQIPRKHLRLGSQQLRIRRVRDARGCQQKYEVGGPSIQIQLYDAPSIYPLESRQDYCVGERIAYTLSGTPPFDIQYEFNGKWNAKSQTTSFRRVAEKPGDFIITRISDKASECRAAVHLPKKIHPLPSVQISRGQQSRVDIHEGGEVDILFEFWGTPPFEFTFTRSTNAKKGHRSVLLETRHDISYEHSKVVKASQEGTYEVVAIKDKFCSYSTQQTDKRDKK